VTRVAALYDVHGMPWALSAVLEEIAVEAVDVILFGGDLVDGPDPVATLELARATGGVFVRGNCEREPDPWVTEQLSAADLRWLAELPQTVALDDVLYCHSTPADDLTLLTAATPDFELRAAFGDIAEPTVVIGHTHSQFDREVADLRVVNAGSVGMPYEDDVAAFWALVADGDPVLRRTSFDVDAAVPALRATGWPGAAEFVAENLLGIPSREEAIAHFERQRLAS
jgi:predicted phosphodiesterase